MELHINKEAKSPCLGDIVRTHTNRYCMVIYDEKAKLFGLLDLKYSEVVTWENDPSSFNEGEEITIDAYDGIYETIVDVIDGKKAKLIIDLEGGCKDAEIQEEADCD